MPEYRDCANAEVLASGTVEHIDALTTIEHVVSTRGLDLSFVGPGDLATNMAQRGRADDPAVLAAIRQFELPLQPSPVILGGVAPTSSQAIDMTNRGYKALVVGFDWALQ
jgi:4-hydroxy-2-oxoheptanedioate aldolase